MNYITFISNEELEVLCGIITGTAFKFYYQQNSKEFSKIKPGFRASKLSDQDAIALAVKFKSKGFISDFINSRADIWLKEISDFYEEQIQAGLSEKEAIAKTLQKSVFSEHIDLYFKLCGKEVSEDEILEISELMPRYIESPEKEIPTIISGSEKEQVMTDSMIEKYNEIVSEISSLKKEKEMLEQQLKDSSNRIEILQAENSSKEEELRDLRQRAEFDDNEVYELQDGGFDHLSFGLVEEEDYQGQMWITRLGDVVNGNITKFIPNDNKPWFFENRTRLYWKDGPRKPGSIGIWSWSAIPNKSDPSKDYVSTAFNPGVYPVEVFVIPECQSIDEVLQHLKGGITYSRTSHRIIAAYKTAKGKYSGLLCNDDNLENSDTVVRINSNVLTLPLYDFTNGDFTYYEEVKKNFLRKLTLGFPQSVIQTKDPLEIVKSIVLKGASWNSFKQKGVSKSEWQGYKEFIESCKTDTVIDDIANACRCSITEANDYLVQFIDCANSYIDGSTIGEQVLLSVIQSNPDLLKKCESLIRDDWEKKNAELLAHEEEKIECAKVERDSVMQEKEAAERKTAEIERRADELIREIAEKEQVAIDVETIVADRIKRAQENAAEFIANMAFINNPVVTSVQTIEPDKKQTQLLIPGTKVSNGDPDECKDYDESLETIAFELAEAGVAEKYACGLAAFLYASYINRMAVMLCGPNSSEIAQAFSVSLFGKLPAVLDCTHVYDSSASHVIEDCEDEVICINSPFSSEWINSVPDIIGDTNKFFIVTHPFAEDVTIEPKSLFNYMTPLFTDFFVEKPATKEFVGGVMSEHYKTYKHKEIENIYPKVFNALHISKLIQYRYQTILTDMYEMLKGKNGDTALIYAFMPYAYVTFQGEKLIEDIDNKVFKDFSISVDIKEQAMRLLGVVNE